MDILLTTSIILVMVALNALYVAAEFATVGSRRSRVQEAAAGGNGAATRLLGILQDPAKLDNYVAACQIGITLSSLVAGAYGQAQLTPLLEPLFGSEGRAIAIVVVLALIAALQVVLGELLPKTAALRYPERLAMLTLPAMIVSQWIFRPLVTIFNGSAFALMRMVNLHVDHSHAHVHSPDELAGLFRASAAGGLIDASERDMLAGVLNVEDRLVREIMTPRRRVVTVPASATVAEALRVVAGSAHSRFPVLDAGDEVSAIVHVRDLFVSAQSDGSASVSTVARPVLAVGEVLAVPRLWQLLGESEQHCAIVVNEYGSVAGMVTLEDALEEVFGEVQDEFDDEVEPITITDGRVSVRGDALVQVLSDRFDLGIESAEVDTVSGLLWHELGHLPAVGESVVIGAHGLVIRVDAHDGPTVGVVSFELPEGHR